jgi:regulatory protein
MRSSTEVEKYLLEKGTSPETTLQALERLKRSGIVDDIRFAQVWTENRSEFRPRSRRALRRELRMKGISDEVIDTTVDEMLPEEELAYQAGIKYARRLVGSDRFEFFRKLGGHLARRGFSYDTIKSVTTRIWNERELNYSKMDEIDSEEDEEER